MAPLNTTPKRRVLSRANALTISDMLLDLVGNRTKSVMIEHFSRAVTKVVNGNVLSTDDGDRIQITFESEFGTYLPVNIFTNQLTEATLRALVTQVKTIAPPKRTLPKDAPADHTDLDPATYHAQTFPPVSLWYDATLTAMESARGEVIPGLCTQLQESRLTGAVTVGLMARSVLYRYKHGLTAFAEETDCEITVTARTPDGKASGWGGQANRNWAKIVPATAATRAIDIATRSRGMVAIEPGRRVAILSPTAVAQLVYEMAYAFDYSSSRSDGYVASMPFSFASHKSGGRKTKYGMRVFDPRIMMVTDPADPLGGFAPFFELRSDIELQIHGYPTPAKTLIDRGVLADWAVNTADGLGISIVPCEVPRSVHLKPAPGTVTATIDEMIANCSEGVYVNRFSDVQLLDRPSGLLTGVTRDGCFLVQNGKITKPIKNFRFTDSPFFAFNRLELIGTPERVAFGYQAPRELGRSRWPRLPIIVPPMMITDFNFSALVDAV